jgi:diadenosine tetraphosphate (Ap4A) HIT family hydrolase
VPSVTECVFCTKVLPQRAFEAETDNCVAFLDGYPCSDGHMLIVPKRCVSRVWELSLAEWLEINAVCHAIASGNPDQEWNIGLNDGSTAGQTVPHVHLHMIPRTEGDVRDPRGGVRWVKPDQARYW